MDHFTKPLQGILFIKFRAEIMNIPDDTDAFDLGWEGSKSEWEEMVKLHKTDDNPIPQECVEVMDTVNYGKASQDTDNVHTKKVSYLVRSQRKDHIFNRDVII